MVICFTSAVGLAYVFRQASDIQRFGGLGATLDQKPGKGEPENFLLVGVDNSEGLNKNDPVLIGRSQASLLSDTIMIIRVDPQTHQAAILSLPRDLYVPIADTGGKAKINSALPGGGPERLIKTIQQNFGIPINGFIEVNFAGFRSLVDAVNGVPIYFPWPARDDHTGFLVEEPGCVTLDGVQALAYARSRYFETKQNGKWTAGSQQRLRSHQPPAAVHQAGAQAGHRQGRPQPVRADPARGRGAVEREARRPDHHPGPARPGP